MQRHVMIDLETLGTKPGCPIISIGAVCFLNHPEFSSKYFYRTITPESQKDVMDAPDILTLDWWSRQSEEARAEVFNNPNSTHLITALQNFKAYLRQLQVNEDDEIVIWGKGASFDEPILAEAFNRTTIPLQWSFRNSLCHRTLEALANMFSIQLPTLDGVKHNALVDARYQAMCAELIIDKLAVAIGDTFK